MEKEKRVLLSEDWASTIMGVFIIVGVLLLYSLTNIRINFPSFGITPDGWLGTSGLTEIVAVNNLIGAFGVLATLFALSVITGFLCGKKWTEFKGFFVLYAITFVAMSFAGNSYMRELGVETVIFCLLIGLFVSNVFGVPDWVRGALQSEMYIKIGLVLMGSTVLWPVLVRLGAVGIIQSVVVVAAVWYFCFWLCKKMKIDEEMKMMLSSAVSICGVSAAVATQGAIKGDKTKLSFVVSLVLVVAVPMILIMPVIAQLIGMQPVLAGAWIGGTVDNTAAVAATGAALGGEAEQAAIIVKASQNVLLGIAAFIISIYWVLRKSKGQAAEENQYIEKPSLKILWDRFPKFVLGFMAASLIFSFVISPVENREAMDAIRSMQGLWFAITFTSIGLETRFKDFMTSGNRKATIAFVTAQIFNVFFTLAIVYLIHLLIGYPEVVLG